MDYEKVLVHYAAYSIQENPFNTFESSSVNEPSAVGWGVSYPASILLFMGFSKTNGRQKNGMGHLWAFKTILLCSTVH